ncbi:MAG: hypothetical protein RLZZ416_748 [Candidatus Parcubacteria bacterium]|jgi:hypothetical protein
MPPSEHEKEKVERLRRAMYSRSLSDKLKDKPRRELIEHEPIVGNEFVRHDEASPRSIVAPRVIGFARAALWWLLGGSIVFFIIAIGFFTYYFGFGPGSIPAAPGNIDISIAGPPQIEGGIPTELQIVVANRNKVPLELAELVITYPKGTRSPTDFSTDLPNQRISLGTIEAGGTRQGTVSAVFAGETGEHADVGVELEYRIAGSSAVFAASSGYSIVFSSSPISIAVTGNHETISGQPVQFTIFVASNANAPVRDVVLSVDYPFGFKFSSANPAPKISNGSSNSTWELGDFPPGLKKTITLQGSLTGGQGDDRVFRFSVGTRSNATSTTVARSLATNAFNVAISKPFLGLSVSVNGASGPGIVLSPGDNVPVVIGWQNNLSTAITDAVIVARLSGLQIDGTTVHTTDGFYRSTDNTMLWDKTTTRGALADLAAGSRGVVGFSFQVPKGDVLKDIVNPRLSISINAAGHRVSETGVPENLQSTTEQKVAIASDLTLTAQGLYYSNPFGSVGPMPPKAGSETTYAVVFTVTNTTNKITQAKVTAHLPPYVRWTGVYSPSSEKIYIDGKLYLQGQSQTPPPGDPCQGTSDICWSIGDIEPGVGLNGSAPRQAAIAIGVTPSTSQIGQEPPLMQTIQLSATDNSGTQILKSVKDVTTNIAGDSGFSSANATVVK